jgi:hypothetical protein
MDFFAISFEKMDNSKNEFEARFDKEELKEKARRKTKQEKSIQKPTKNSVEREQKN